MAYLAATLLFGALSAPLLFWAAQWMAAHGIFPALAQYDFERFFHRAVLIGAIAFLWPLLRWARVRSWRDLGLSPNRSRRSDVVAGFFLAAIPLLGCGVLFLGLEVYGLRSEVRWYGLAKATLSAVTVPLIEESLFRGLFLGVLLRSNGRLISLFVSSALFSILHFLKAPEATNAIVTWASGFNSIANSFSQFGDPKLLLAGFTTLFLIGWILADARIRTRSLWLPTGLHAGWIFANAAFNKFARREFVALPWLGKNLLIGIVPLGVGLLTWLLVYLWLRYARKSKS